jgi:hypothetical protein
MDGELYLDTETEIHKKHNFITIKYLSVIEILLRNVYLNGVSLNDVRLKYVKLNDACLFELSFGAFGI